MKRPVYIQRIASVHPTGSTHLPHLKADEPDYKTSIPYPAIRRRMSRMIKMGVACGLQCLQDTRPEEVEALITATGLGCMGDTEKFLEALIRQNEEMLNPTPFIQSTFNTIGGQIALLLHIQTYNVTYVHRGLSFESALIDGWLSVNEGKNNVLVEAIDEITPTQFALMQRLGMARHACLGEGAQAFLLGREQRAETLGLLLGCAPFTSTGMPETEQVQLQLTEFLREHQLAPQDIRLWVNGQGTDRSENTFYDSVRQLLLPQTPEYAFKTECGEYPTASAFGMYRAVQQLRNLQHNDYVLISNLYAGNQYSFILIQCP